jgi:hypothetical protein
LRGVARGIAVALCEFSVIPLVAVSGSECVEALQQAGFVTRSRSEASITLAQGERVVAVPDCAMLAPEDLELVLRDAGITYDDFLDLLSDTPTNPDLRLPLAARDAREH